MMVTDYSEINERNMKKFYEWSDKNCKPQVPLPGFSKNKKRSIIGVIRETLSIAIIGSISMTPRTAKIYVTGVTKLLIMMT